MEKINIREMKADDYPGVRAVDELTQRQYLGSQWDHLTRTEKDVHLQSRQSEFELNLQTGYCFVAVMNETVIGFVLAHETLPFRDMVYIRYVAIHPDYQGGGIGSLLYQVAIDKARQNGIEKISALINLDNSKSIKLHEKLGFELIDRKEAILSLRGEG